MIRREDWKAAHRDLVAEGRERAGEPPTAEEVQDLFDGKLAEADAERVRELLAYYPDMARAMTRPFPEDAAGALTDDEIAADLAKVRARIGQTAADPVPLRRPWFFSRGFAIAAGVIVAIALAGIAFWRTPVEPRMVATKILYPDGDRGGTPAQAPVPLSTSVDYTLRPAFSSGERYMEYRIELLDLASEPPRRVWTRERIEPQQDGTYPVELETRKLDPGLYRLVLYGDNGTPVRLAQYTLRLSAP